MTILSLFIAAVVAASPSPAPTTAPSAVATTVAATVPDAKPTPTFPSRDASGIVWFVYDAGLAPTAYCASGSECAIKFEPGERVTRTVTVKGPDDSVWSIQPSNPESDDDPLATSYVFIAPLVSSPASTLFVETNKRLYTIMLAPDKRAIGYTYAFHIPDERNTVTLPVPIDRTYKYGDDPGNVAPVACPVRGYTSFTEHEPNFAPTGITVAQGLVRFDFDPGVPLPSVGAPTREIRDVDNLTALPTSTDYAPNRRSIVVLACYPTIVLYMNTTKGRAAIVYQSHP